MGGLTISFWVYLDESKIRKDQDAYIISSGGQSKKSRGFAFLYFHGNYTACLSTADKQWKMTITDLPQKEWINIAFLWQKNEQLTYYLNGEKKDFVEGTPTSRPTVKFTILTISRPNNAVNVEFMYPLRMSSLALWDKWLNDEQVKACFNSCKFFFYKTVTVKLPSKGVPGKMCFKNMQQIYRRQPMPMHDFNKVANQLYRVTLRHG